MMNCKCGIKAFFFEKTTSDGVFNVFKCDAPESKKKGKCDFFYSQKIKDPVIWVTEDVIQTMETFSEEVKPRDAYMKVLNKYIRLLKNTTHLPKEYSANYIANINYILKRLNMEFYFEDTESIECLEKRVKNNECRLNIPIYTSLAFPLRLTEYPPDLKVSLKRKCKKTRKIKSRLEFMKIDLKNFIEEDEKDKQEEEIDNKSVCSINSSEMSGDTDIDDDNTFDVEGVDSDIDESIDDTGAFSD